MLRGLVGRPHRRRRSAQWPLLDQHHRYQRNDKEHRRGDEHPAEQRREMRWPPSPDTVSRNALDSTSAQNDRGKHRHDDRTAELAEEIKRAGRDSELMRQDRILDHYGRE